MLRRFELVVVDFSDFVFEHAFGEGSTAKLDDARRFLSNEGRSTSTQDVVARPTEQIVAVALRLVGQSHDELRIRFVIIVAFFTSVPVAA